ncbi:MAG: hypothetical protein GF308_15440 [Candidatus Heimdallarchaeota archaeon]|nr:hypothetical protein [Candidatus Heimdallarchaeota archaeon]
MAQQDDLLIFQFNQQKDTFRLIMLLYNNGRMYSSQVREFGMNDRTIMRARTVLRELELITISSAEGSRRLYYDLTYKGRQVAEKLLELERLLFSD